MKKVNTNVSQGEPPTLPDPPEIRRRMRLYPYQVVGMAALFLLPLAAAAGFLQTESSRVAKTGPITLEAEFPSTLRDRTVQPLTITARNNGESEMQTLTICLDCSYLAAFDEVQSIPEPEEISDKGAIYRFSKVMPGESRRVSLEFQSGEAGCKVGTVTATGDSGQPTSVQLRTLVLP